jgi:acyl transferase domain-containing protein
MLEQGVILPNIHFERPNKRILFKQVIVPTTVMPWPEGVQRRASVNSFGYGGTNAHAIVEAFVAPPQQPRDNGLDGAPNDRSVGSFPRRLFVLTGRESKAVQEMCKKYASYVEGVGTMANPDIKFDNLAYTLGRAQSKLEWAVSHVASDFEELGRKLSTADMKPTRSSKTRVGFVFTGQGAQWPRMGLGLMEYRTYRESVEAADEYLSQHLGCRWSVIEELEKHGKESLIGAPEFAQPLCTIIQVAMVDLLRSWQVRPTAVVGHSSGEIAAAYCTGAITKQAAWQIAFQRGRECASLKMRAPELQGAMLVAGLSAEAVKPYLDAFVPGHINVACINSPNLVTISGDAPEIRELLAVLSADNIFARELPVENAYHSPHMELLAETYLHSIADVIVQEEDASTDMEMISSVTGQLVKPAELTPQYWVRNLVSPVLFSDAVTAMLRGSKKTFRRKTEPAVNFLLELGPHATLQKPLLDIAKSEMSRGVGYTSMLLRGKDAFDSVMTAAGDLFRHGYPVDISAVNNIQQECRILVDLPAYPWNRSNKYWAVSRTMHNYLHRASRHHGLLGVERMESDDLNPAWINLLDFQENPWIREHVVHGAILYPGAGFLVMAIEAARQLARSDREVANVILRDVRIVKALVIKEEERLPEIMTRFWRSESLSDGEWSGSWRFEISSAKDRVVEQHAMGQIMLDYSPVDPYLSPASTLVHEARKVEYAKLMETSVDTMEKTDFYDASKDAGLAYGPDFQGIIDMTRGSNSCCWSIEVTDRRTSTPDHSESEHLIHPTTLDAIVHSMFGAMNKGKDFQNAALPIAFDSIIISARMPADAGTLLSGFTVTTELKEREIVADIYVSSRDWTQSLVQIEGLHCTELPSQHTEVVAVTPRSALLGSIEFRPCIDLLDERSLKSYVTENCSHGSSTDTQSSEFSERLRNAVAQVRNDQRKSVNILEKMNV